MTPDSFLARMRELDDVLAQCRGHAPFADAVVRDTSNRSGLEWPWWSIAVERTEEDGSEKRRIYATILLNSTQQGDPDFFEGRWRARIWRDVGVDSFHQHGAWPLDWAELPTPQMLVETTTALLAAARAALEQAVAERSR